MSPRLHLPWLATTSVMLATIIQVLDTTIANVALPHMQGHLGAGSDQITWVLTSYIVATAIMTLPVGYLAKRYGRREVMLTAVVGFTLTSMLCGQAGSLEEMVFWRILQGVFGAPLAPLSQSIMLDSYPREKHASAMSLWGMGVMLGPILGPTLGGWLTDSYSWRWVFYINVPLGIISFVGIWLTIAPSPRERQRMDFRGFLLLALAVASLQLLLDRGEHADWFEALEIQLYCVLGLLAMYLFTVHSIGNRNSFLSPALFRDRNFVTGTLFTFLLGIVLLATMALMPPFLQQWQGYPVMTAGMVLMPRGIGTMAGMLAAPRLLRFFDARAVILVGMGLLCLSLWQMSGFTLDVGTRDLVITGLLQGLGLGLVVVPTTTLAYATLAPELRNEGAGLYSLARNLGNSVGIAIVMSVLTRKMWINQQELGERLQPDPGLLALLPDTSSLSGVPGMLITEIQRQAAEIAFANDFMLLLWINLLAMPLVLLLREARH